MLSGAQLAFQEWECAVSPPSAVAATTSERPESSVLCTAKEMFRLAVPRRGHVLSTVVEVYGKPIREAVAVLSGSLAREHCSAIRASLFLPRCEQLSPDIVRSDAEMAAWAIVSMWVVGVAAKV